MKSKILVLIIVIVVLGGGFFFFGGSLFSLFQNNNSDSDAISQYHLTVYKSLSCGCCGWYVSYLKRHGFRVDTVNMSDLDEIKTKYHVPNQLRSCHTTLAGNYVVEGHIPVEAIKKLLDEKPDIGGIAMAGMPSGSPGMPGAKSGPFKIHSISKTGEDLGIFTEL